MERLTFIDASCSKSHTYLHRYGVATSESQDTTTEYNTSDSEDGFQEDSCNYHNNDDGPRNTIDDGCHRRLIENPPYVEGFEFAAVRHNPSPPFGESYNTEYPKIPRAWKELSQTELCISQKCPSGNSHPYPKTKFKITACLRTGSARGAQLVIVNHAVVAKIFDPLYYSPIDENGFRELVVQNAEGDYRREAAAYEALHNSRASAVTPRFLGSWITSINTTITRSGKSEQQVRKVPLLLLEYIRGTTMLNIDPACISPVLRSSILKSALYADALILHAGVLNLDVSPRNVIVVEPSPSKLATASNCETKVIIIDFNKSVVCLHPNSENREIYEERNLRKNHFESMIPNPIIRYSGRLDEFGGWVPDSLHDDTQWLWDNFHNEKGFRPVVWDPQDPETDPEYLEEGALFLSP